mmetsp:Transcript_26472/g.41211  ORF Transcript_26472/g.41211 Transcript_26472/m.41211 type:complete len:158 (-) Transcript_26472:427-900(-)|eukprot:CAMPEP_0201514712 /NCGR_PEP_ID=MMETSP0161_2-20130828/6479_1 /ASSEMBLY_ACC=CAM_ASM_000251 /TAXON_ID=180227 /ORGANISM="Neoparamoeba aestuarina, Strain SoJaBio B1-5/56/2" /LENGTH=157 /DNA_ID=CAMNT_0047911341 /DNA_START=77 /DNA_END=550 /DNA_ORIENTATION=-
MSGGGLEMFSCEWPEPGGACWDILKWEPCCGDPCNPMDGAYCCFCWYCCGWCSFAKLYASALDQEECALINHCLILCCNICGIFNIITRHLIRIKVGAGPEDMDLMGWIGDCVMVWCCCCCAACQELRAVEIKDWDWWKQFSENGTFPIIVDPFKIL